MFLAEEAVPLRGFRVLETRCSRGWRLHAGAGVCARKRDQRSSRVAVALSGIPVTESKSCIYRVYVARRRLSLASCIRVVLVTQWPGLALDCTRGRHGSTAGRSGCARAYGALIPGRWYRVASRANGESGHLSWMCRDARLVRRGQLWIW